MILATGNTLYRALVRGPVHRRRCTNVIIVRGVREYLYVLHNNKCYICLLPSDIKRHNTWYVEKQYSVTGEILPYTLFRGTKYIRLIKCYIRNSSAYLDIRMIRYSSSTYIVCKLSINTKQYRHMLNNDVYEN